jgi:dihydrolipoamide dehydrogenase
MYDVIITGAGPGGYIAAERAGAEGKSVLLIEKSHLGGVCLNEGCIPTKTLLNSAKIYSHAEEAGDFGVEIPKADFNLKKAMEWKDKVIETLRKGVAYQMKRFKVDVVQGEAEFLEPKKVKAGDKTYEGKNIIIATGSSSIIPSIEGADTENILTSREILNITKIPESLCIIGGGVIGMEFASLFSALGTEVHVIEMLDEIIPLMDGVLAKMMRKSMKNINFSLSSKVTAFKKNGKKISVTFEKDGKTEKAETEYVLLSVGRKPNTEGMGLEKTGLDFDRKGIRVNSGMQTNLPGVYAIGDVTGKSLLAHSASRMAEVAVDNICAKSSVMRYKAVPWAVYTDPEAAGCGLTEKEAKKAGLDIKTGSMQMRANGRFLAEHGSRAPGICRIITDAGSGLLLGVHMYGAKCSELIFGASLMIEAELRVKDIREVIFPHPTLSEIIRDTAIEIN